MKNHLATFAKGLSAIFAISQLAGCGIIKVNMPGGSSGGSSGGGGGNPLSALTGNYDQGALEKATIATFNAWTFESCEESYKCVGAFKKQIGVTEYRDSGTYVYEYNPRRTLKNPDPAWLTEWDKISEDEHLNTADETYQALLVAAGRRTWQTRCYADFAALDTEWRANDAKWNKDIDSAVKISEPYARITAVRALMATAIEDAHKAQSLIDHMKTDVGYANTLNGALKGAYDSTGRDYLYAIQAPPRLGRVRPRLSAEIERDLYCFRAMSSGTSKTPALPSFAGGDSYTERGAKFVRPIFTQDQREKLAKLADEQAIAAEKAFVPGKFNDAWANAVFDGKAEISGHPKLAHMPNYGEIKKISTENGKQVLEIAEHSEGAYSYDCVETNKFDHWDGNGHAVYRSICKEGKEVSDLAVEIVVGADLPAGVVLAVGDRIEGFATVQAHVAKTLVDTKPYVKKSESWAFELQHLTSISRKGKVVSKWW